MVPGAEKRQRFTVSAVRKWVMNNDLAGNDGGCRRKSGFHQKPGRPRSRSAHPGFECNASVHVNHGPGFGDMVSLVQLNFEHLNVGTEGCENVGREQHKKGEVMKVKPQDTGVHLIYRFGTYNF
jgi:hypothetical protein